MSLREDLIYLPALLMDMGTGSITLGAVFFASRLGASPLIIGVMASAYRLLYVFFCQVFGRLSDRVSRKKLTQTACLSFAILQFLVPFCRRLYQLVVFFPLTGVVLAALWPALEAWVGERGDGRPLVKRVSIFNLFWTGGLMIGYFGAGYLGYIGNVQTSALFYFASIAALCATAAITIQPEPESGEQRAKSGELGAESREPRAESQEEEALSPASCAPCSPPSALRSARYLYLSWAANCVSYLTLSIMRHIFPKFIDQRVGELGIASRMAPLMSGLLLLCQAGAQFIMFFILGTTERWRHRFAPLLIFQILSSLGFLAVWLSDSPRFWAFGLMLIGLNVGMTYFSSIYYSLYGNVDLGSKSGWHESILHSGTTVGPSIGGALADYISLKSPYLFCAAAVIAGLPVQVFILRRKHNERQEVSPCP